MALWAIVKDKIPTLLDTGKPLRVNDVQYTLDVFELAEANRAGWSLAELEKLGVYRVNETPVPEGKKIIEKGLEFTGTAVNRTYVYEDRPVVLPTRDDVNAERDRRIVSGFQFQDKVIQTRDEDRENITGASILATVAIMGGAQPGDYRWHGGVEDFVWITLDNSMLRLDAQSVIALGSGIARWKSLHIFAAHAIKNGAEIPLDYADDKYWPVVGG